jgi:hypothetical protein
MWTMWAEEIEPFFLVRPAAGVCVFVPHCRRTFSGISRPYFTL